MSPIDLIRIGIEKADWSSVCEGYSQMTGDEVVVPQAKTKHFSLEDVVLTVNGKTVWSTINLLAPESFEKTPEEPNRAGAESDRPFVEQEEDYEEETGGIFSTSKAESKALSKARAGVTRELRQKFTPLKLQCVVCQNTFDVHPDLKPIRLDKDDDEPQYRCDNCITKPRK